VQQNLKSRCIHDERTTLPAAGCSRCGGETADSLAHPRVHGMWDGEAGRVRHGERTVQSETVPSETIQSETIQSETTPVRVVGRPVVKRRRT